MARFSGGSVAIGDNGGGDRLVLLADTTADRFGDAVTGGITRRVNSTS